MRIDLHSHSTVSDGTDTPVALIAAAVRAGLDVLALTDHDTFDGLADAAAAAEAAGIVLCTGMEMSTEVDGRSVHLLGYGCDPADPALTAELAAVREGRTTRLPTMVARLTELGMPLTVAEVERFAQGSPSIGRPHVADAMIARGYVGDRTEAFDRWLGDDKPGYVDRYTTELERAIALVHGAGGAAVLAHPRGRGTASVLTEDYVANLVAEHGLDGIEVDHPDHDEAARAGLRALAVRVGVPATGSSDYHGTGKADGFGLGACTTAPEAYQRLCAAMASRASTRPGAAE